MEKDGEFERMALKLGELNFAFESARAGNSDREFSRMSRQFEEMRTIGVKTESSDSV
ncbi:MAG: hypothetical protein PHS17_06530 [Desulfobacterales bacterium]|nr:hypothetical protein [Desulfobacterales bacterium]